MKSKRQNAQSLRLALLLAGGLMSVGFSSSGMAQAPGGMPAASDDSHRAVTAGSMDVAEGKALAASACAKCHGEKGISKAKGVPNLAGQRPGYLYLEMKAYQNGGRSNKNMEAAVKFLSNDALVKVAAYFASLDSPAPVSAKPAPAKPSPLQAGKAATVVCANCHGETGQSKAAGMPNLSGQYPNILVASMKAYKGGQRKHDMMKSLLAEVPEANFDNIALYYALQKPAKAPTPATGDQAAGKAAAAGCTPCHGEQGVSGNPAVPSLAGQDPDYLVEALKAYKGTGRDEPTMKNLAAALDEKTMKNLAAFYAGLQPQQPKVKEPLTTAEWVQRCDRCHGLHGNSTDPHVPALAAQRVEYLDQVLRAYQKGERRNTTMAAMTSVLSDAEIDNLANYYAQQKPRAVVYLAPGK